MRTSKFTEMQIAGVPVEDICRQAGTSVATYYQWKKASTAAWRRRSF